MDKPPKLELNIIAKPTGNWVIPTTVAEIRAALPNGVCVETLYDGDWMPLNPFSTYTQGRLTMWINEKIVRFNMDKKVIYTRMAVLKDADFTFLQPYTVNIYQQLVDAEAGVLFKEWVNSRSYFVVGKDTHV